jgi:hypothetical protein
MEKTVMFCQKCGGLLAILREPARIYSLFFPLGKEIWEAVRCSECGHCWHRTLVENTGWLKKRPRISPGLAAGEPILDELCPIPKRFTTKMAGPGRVLVTYRYAGWLGEKRPTFLFSSSNVTFRERSSDWQEVGAARSSTESITAQRAEKTRDCCVNLHAGHHLLCLLEMVSEKESDWIGRMVSIWSGIPFHQADGETYWPPLPPVPAPPS